MNEHKDRRTVELFLCRDEKAIELSREKYGRLCMSVARNILGDERDAEECFNEALFAAWNNIPPARPDNLGAYLVKLTRNIALKRARYNGAEKRGGGNVDAVLDELAECIPGDNVEDPIESKRITDVINSFLASLPVFERRIFLRRYWHADSIAVIARDVGCSEGKIKMTLARTRKKLRRRLEKEDIWI